MTETHDTQSPDTVEVLNQITKQLGNEKSLAQKPSSEPKIVPAGLLPQSRGSLEKVQSHSDSQSGILIKTITTEQIIKTILILAGVGLSAYNVYQSFQIEYLKDKQNLRGVSIVILVIFVILLCMVPFHFR